MSRKRYPEEFNKGEGKGEGKGKGNYRRWTTAPFSRPQHLRRITTVEVHCVRRSPHVAPWCDCTVATTCLAISHLQAQPAGAVLNHLKSLGRSCLPISY